MMRLFVVLLLLAVFFLSGTVFGMNQDSPSVLEMNEETNIQEDPVPVAEKEIVSVSSQPGLNETSSIQNTQKTASVLEAGVKGFFEILMALMYQIAQLFF
ncbi:hypothetical protein ACFOUV_02770 [Oceanobacillus longus]|uniref:DUF3679 domain-containing protein n=1 Tax=Oceanobacillus longus TaxID=930120 RepID=A0ABV8GX48_9BACI